MAKFGGCTCKAFYKQPAQEKHYGLDIGLKAITGYFSRISEGRIRMSH